MAIHLRKEVAVAIALKCLILMISTQPGKADTCFNSSDDMQFCEDIEFLKMTVIDKFFMSPNDVVKCKVHQVFKSVLGMSPEREIFLNIPTGYACPLNFEVDSKYVLMVKVETGFHGQAGRIKLLIKETEQMIEGYVSILLVQKESSTL